MLKRFIFSTLDSDRLPVVSVIQLLKNTVLVCFPDCAKLVGFSGRLRRKLRQPNTITFDGLNIQSVGKLNVLENLIWFAFIVVKQFILFNFLINL